MKVLLFLTLLQFIWLIDVSVASCSRGSRCDNYDLDDDCFECSSSCDCDLTNCNKCAGTDRCCQSCCDNKRRCHATKCNIDCDCRRISCSSCSISPNECCKSCCDCKPTKCNRGCGGSCNSISCSSCVSESTSCCRDCCSKSETTVAPQRPEPIIQQAAPCCTPNITLPNITIIINQSPIYINNTSPAINVNNQCGNHTAVQGNGTHVTYVYANSTTCPNKTCCRIPWRRPCIPTRAPPYYYCPPSQPMFQCGASCFNPPVPQAPCYQTQSWPYYQCPTAGCYGYGCYQEQSVGCYPLPQWPYYQCPPTGGAAAYGSSGYAQIPPGSNPYTPLSYSGGEPMPVQLPTGNYPPSGGGGLGQPYF